MSRGPINRLIRRVLFLVPGPVVVVVVVIVVHVEFSSGNSCGLIGGWMRSSE